MERVKRLLESALCHKPYSRPLDELAAAWSDVDADVWATDPRRWDVEVKFMGLMAISVKHQRLCIGWDARMVELHAQVSKDYYTSLDGGNEDDEDDEANEADKIDDAGEVEATVDPAPVPAPVAAPSAAAADRQSKRSKRRVVAPLRFGTQPSTTPALHVVRDTAIMRHVVEQRPYVVHRPNGTEELIAWITRTLKPKCAWELTHDFVRGQIAWLARLSLEQDHADHAALMAAQTLAAMVQHYQDASDADLVLVLDRTKTDDATAASPTEITFDDVLLQEVFQRRPPLGTRQPDAWEAMASGLNARLGAKVFFSGPSCKARVATLRAVARGVRQDALVELSDAHKTMLAELERLAASHKLGWSKLAGCGEGKPTIPVSPCGATQGKRVVAVDSSERVAKQPRRTCAVRSHSNDGGQDKGLDVAAARATALPVAPVAAPTKQARAHQSTAGATHDGFRDKELSRETVAQLALALANAEAIKNRCIEKELATMAAYRPKCEAAADTTLRDALAAWLSRP